MFLDASVIFAVLNREDGWQQYAEAIKANIGSLAYSPLVRFEAVLALARVIVSIQGQPMQEALLTAEAVFDNFALEIEAVEIPITAEIGRGVLLAARIYGKMVGHKAALNLGDCYAYASAKSLNGGLLYKGNDFSETDLA